MPEAGGAYDEETRGGQQRNTDARASRRHQGCQ